ncbi:MAG: hypothetical protein Q8O67_02680 [Deltaproteobacteria bacterium]|nr:hypothetical protein [Deltaproteobacteria bacterium]
MSPLLLTLLFAAQEPPGLRVRVDPFVTLVAGGASVGFDVLPSQIDSRLSVAAFVVDVPRFLVPFVVDHDPRLRITETCFQIGWLTSSLPFAGPRQHTGFFFGPELYAYQLRYTDEDEPSRNATAFELYVHATAGFTWFPFEGAADVYVMPWLTAGLPVFGTGGAAFADGTTIEDRAFNWHGTVSIGLQLF